MALNQEHYFPHRQAASLDIGLSAAAESRKSLTRRSPVLVIAICRPFGAQGSKKLRLSSLQEPSVMTPDFNQEWDVSVEAPPSLGVIHTHRQLVRCEQVRGRIALTHFGSFA